jgi:hypothetical protein
VAGGHVPRYGLYLSSLFWCARRFLIIPHVKMLHLKKFRNTEHLQGDNV